MAEAAHGKAHVRPHIRRSATEHWDQIRRQKTNTLWIFLGIAVVLTVGVAAVYFLIL